MRHLFCQRTFCSSGLATHSLAQRFFTPLLPLVCLDRMMVFPKYTRQISLITETTALMLLWVILAALNKSGFFSSFSLFSSLCCLQHGGRFQSLWLGVRVFPNKKKASTEKKPSKSYPSVAACFPTERSNFLCPRHWIVASDHDPRGAGKLR